MSSAVYLSSRALAWLVIQNRSFVGLISHFHWEGFGGGALACELVSSLLPPEKQPRAEQARDAVQWRTSTGRGLGAEIWAVAYAKPRLNRRRAAARNNGLEYCSCFRAPHARRALGDPLAAARGPNRRRERS